MDMNINIKINDKKLSKIYQKLINLEQAMNPLLTQVKSELTEIKDLTAAIEASHALLITEVRKLIALGDVTGADELLAEAQDVKAELAAAVQANTDLAAEVDAVNG